MGKTSLALILAAGLSISGAAQATLFDRGGGMIYDNDLNITWLADANYAKTSGYDSDGFMNWAAAKSWAANLVYGGYTDWRLPTTVQPDPGCTAQFPSQAYGVIGSYYNCTNSEMGHLFYSELGGVAGVNLASTHNAQYNLFHNIMPGLYWSETEYPPLIANYAWWFSFGSGGYQNAIDESTGVLVAWAVRPGDVAIANNVPEPATLLLIGFGLAGLGATRLRRVRPDSAVERGEA